MRCPVCKSRTVADEHIRHEAPPHRKNPHAIFLVLDNIRSAYNVGSLLRTADSVGVQHVHLCGITPDAAHPKVRKTSLGSEEVPTTRWQDTRECIAFLKNEGHHVVALECVSGATPIHQVPRRSMTVVVGNEVCGVDQEVLNQCDEITALPQLGNKISLNVASAGAIALYALSGLTDPT